MSSKNNTVDQLIRGGVFDVNMDKLIGALLPTDEDMAQQKTKSDLKLVCKDAENDEAIR